MHLWWRFIIMTDNVNIIKLWVPRVLAFFRRKFKDTPVTLLATVTFYLTTIGFPPKDSQKQRKKQCVLSGPHTGCDVTCDDTPDSCDVVQITSNHHLMIDITAQEGKLHLIKSHQGQSTDKPRVSDLRDLQMLNVLVSSLVLSACLLSVTSRKGKFRGKCVQ